MGFADAGQLGIGVIEEKPYQWPQVVQTLNSILPKDIVSGMDHMVALGAGGDVYTWGLGGFGQLGIGPTSSEGILALPQRVEGIPPLSIIFSGADHSGGVDGTTPTNSRRSRMFPLSKAPPLTLFERICSTRTSMGLG